jgi:hypothetical protein
MRIEGAATSAHKFNRSWDIAVPAGFVVKGVYKDPATGVDAFMAYNDNTKQVVVGVAGTNSFADPPDRRSDVIALGTDQARLLFSDGEFRADFGAVAASAGGAENLSIVFAGQSLGGGVAKQLGMAAVYGIPGAAADLGLRADQVSVVSYNGFGTEYASQLLGFTEAQQTEFAGLATVLNFATQNVRTGEFDIVSAMGGKSFGDTYVLPVDDAGGTSIAFMHRTNFGIRLGIEALDGDLTRAQPIDGVPPSSDGCHHQGQAQVCVLRRHWCGVEARGRAARRA